MIDSVHKEGCLFCGHLKGACSSQEIAYQCQFYHESEEVPKETVNHPQHYGGDTTYETIKVLKAWLTKEQYEGALVFNAIKYLSRYRKKGGTEDIKKAQWYVNKLVEDME